MQIMPQYDNLEFYLESSDIIDFGYLVSREVTDLSFEITTYSKDEVDYIKNAYEYVRDKISQLADINSKKITCKASEVLREKEGTCFSKAHLLAAILRCNLIPTGFCYQRIILNEHIPRFILHGFNAVYIEEYHRWIQLDARGNTADVDAQFSLDTEKLAFSVQPEYREEDIPIIFSAPDRKVISALTTNKSFFMLWSNFPTRLEYEKK